MLKKSGIINRETNEIKSAKRGILQVFFSVTSPKVLIKDKFKLLFTELPSNNSV